ncbi:hypothetical protein PIROE2DRAFT_59549 [Piromyces sp. E2]|nr:hypothetical protein PIROE2DRAFT_59549 [Piromyces sp. E2]|eukprot:OUM66164.1 hypothetical protein PIROE2DRAFT_59549 [Piromyces sp. E2]
MERTQELCLGILGNIACFESLYSSLYENEVLITIIGLTFSTSMDPEVLFSCCRLINNLIIGFCKLTYLTNSDSIDEKGSLSQGLKFHKAFIKCFQTFDIYKKFFFILENSLHSNLLKEVLDILYLLYSTVFLKEYFIFYTIEGMSLQEDSNENEKIKNAQYNWDVFKHDVDYLLEFIHRNLEYLNYEKRHCNSITGKELIETKEQDDKKNKDYVSCKIFFEVFESKIEATLSLLRIVYTLFQNNNLLMTDEKTQQDIIITILEWIQLQFNDMPKDFKEIENFEKFIEKEEEKEKEEKDDPLLLDSIELSFKILYCYIQNNRNQTSLLHKLFFHQNNKYVINDILKCLIVNCIPKETGWKLLNWMAQEIKHFVQELYTNLINLKNNNTRLVVQSLLLNSFDILNHEGNKISINPKIQNQDKINENIRHLVYTMAHYSPYYSRGIEQDAEETYGDVKQRTIQKKLYQLLEQKIKTLEIKNEQIIKYVKGIIYDKEVEMDYYEKAYQLERLIIDTCCLLLTLDEIYEIVHDEQDTESRLNFEPINNLLMKLWEN